MSSILGAGERVEGTNRSRLIIVTIDTLMALFKDYLPGYVPEDATPLELFIHPSTPGKMAILTESSNWDSAGNEVNVRFELRRSYGV